MKFCFGFTLSQLQATYTKLFPANIQHTMNSFAGIRSTIPRQLTQNIRLERLWKTNGTARSRRHRWRVERNRLSRRQRRLGQRRGGDLRLQGRLKRWQRCPCGREEAPSGLEPHRCRVCSPQRSEQTTHSHVLGCLLYTSDAADE